MLKYYENALNNEMLLQPNDEYTEIQQAFYNEQWENTSARIKVEEQDDIGLNTYHEVEVWINKVVGMTTTFAKTGDDYRQLVFKSIDYVPVRGLYYKFENNTWIRDFMSPSEGLVSDITVRRCNNFLRIIDPIDGSLFSIPCVVDYDMLSPSIQVSSYILTPNNHAVVYVQANEDTLRLFTLNKRFILNGRPFKIYAFQNALNHSETEQTPTVLYLDLYLDELQPYDDLINQVAYNGEYNYLINIDSNAVSAPMGTKGQLTATVLLNGQQVDREIVWKVDNDLVVLIASDGRYELTGQTNDTALITAYLKDNPKISSTIPVIITEKQVTVPKIILSPNFTKIKQYQALSVDVKFELNGNIIGYDELNITDKDNKEIDSDYYEITLFDKSFVIKCNKVSIEPISIKISVYNKEKELRGNLTHTFSCVSMLD